MIPSGVPSTPKRTARQQVAFESKREREFYRYYEPIQSLSHRPPTLCDLNDQDAVRTHQPSSSPDRALTAFTQLAALRLGARRAMLFFFDANYAYVLAEATRTLSLQDDSRHDIADGLWLGATMIPRGFSVCEVTVNLPANSGTNANDMSSSSIIHIINDLNEDTRFCDRPYVKSGPMARFYAGVPITTPKGINIGAFCILDDKSRDGLSQSETLFLCEMATTTMTHLENIRARAENQRSRDMTVGLGAFIEGKSSLGDWWLQNDQQRLRKSSKVAQLDHHKAVRARREQASEEEDAMHRVGPGISGPLPTPPGSLSRSGKRQASTSHPVPPSMSASTVPMAVSADGVEAGAEEALNAGVASRKPVSMPDVEKASCAAGDLQEEMLSGHVRSTFTRAAGLIREAVDVDGTMFLDASIGSFGGLVGNSRGRLNATPSTDTSAASDQGSPKSASSRISTTSASDKSCSILGAAYSPVDERAHEENPESHQSISEGFLRSLLRRYPRGRIWNFNEQGDASSDDLSDESQSRLTKRGGDTQHLGQDPKDTIRVKRKRKWARVNDGRMVQTLFPGVRSLILVGMWDSHRDRWFASAVVWTYSPIRVLSTAVELNYIAAFCDVVMAEVWRLDAQMMDRAKTDFISSISHELRSPLHGILGSVECLQEDEHDPVTEELIRSINSCGTTLLDIISHLLEYARINHYSQDPAAGSDSDSRGRRKTPSGSRPAIKTKLSGMMALDADVSLDALTEDVVETACTGFLHRRISPEVHDLEDSESLHDVCVVLDIDPPAGPGWFFRVRAGAWRRICINLVSNALKYTHTGYVQVTLHAAPMPAKNHTEPGAVVTLTVSDSGIGMSRAFLNTQCFKPFQQENSLVEGTGLGLSLVAKIVKALDGTVDVKSEKGVGTEVRITIPLDYTPVGIGSNTAQQALQALQARPDYTAGSLSGMTVGLVGFTDIDAAGSNGRIANPKQAGRQLLLDSLRKSLLQLGLRTYLFRDKVDPNANLHLITEKEARLLRRKQRKENVADVDDGSLRKLANLPVIVLCDTASSSRELKSTHSTDLLGSRVEYIPQPAGPAKIRKAILACLSIRTTSTQRRARSSSAVMGNSVPSSAARDALSEGADFHDIEGVTFSLPIRDDSRQRRPGNGISDLISPHSTGMAPETYPFPPIPAPTTSSPESMSDLPTPASPPALELTWPAPPIPAVKPRVTFARQTVSPRKLPDSRREIKDQIPLLLVDDNHINLQLLITFAKKAGHHYSTAQNGLEAFETYKRLAESVRVMPKTPGDTLRVVGNNIVGAIEVPRAILLDINMPVMSGFEAARAIRSFEQEAGMEATTIIALTGLGSADAQQEAFSSGVDLFLTKPVRLKELTKVLDGVKKPPGHLL